MSTSLKPIYVDVGVLEGDVLFTTPSTLQHPLRRFPGEGLTGPTTVGLGESPSLVPSRGVRTDRKGGWYLLTYAWTFVFLIPSTSSM